MSLIIRKTASSPANLITPPQSPSQVRFVQKIAKTNFKSPQNKTMNWGPERMFTPGQAVGYNTPLGIKYVDGEVQLFCSNQNSHGLIMEDGQVIGASVTTEIRTQTNRKNEKKTTFIQYDKTLVNQKDADFKVNAINRKRDVNYQGGHLIDHKYSAENSHTTEKNYFPQQFMINAPFKEYLVRRCKSFVEILLYTQHPPTIGVMGAKNKKHSIPIGEIFIQSNQNKIQDVYFFPNNDFNYEGLKERLRITKDIAAKMALYFKLEPCFQPLLKAALVTDFTDSKTKKQQQKENEETFIPLMDEVIYGMGLDKRDEKESKIVQLAYSVLHEGGVVHPQLLLIYNNDRWDKMKSDSLIAPFNALGRFLITYVIRNALKSEVLSTHTRLLFLSGIVNFIEVESEMNNEGWKLVNSLVIDFKKTFKELRRIKETMTLKDLFFFTNIYQRISHVSNNAFFSTGHKICFQNQEVFFRKYIKLLQFLASSYKPEELDRGYASSFLQFIGDARDTLKHHINNGFSEKEFEKEAEFLDSMDKPCLELFQNQNTHKGMSSTKTNTNKTTKSKSKLLYLKQVFNDQGFSDSEE